MAYIGLFHVIPAWLLFVVLYVTGCEIVDWSSIPFLSLFITSLSTLGTSRNLTASLCCENSLFSVSIFYVSQAYWFLHFVVDRLFFRFLLRRCDVTTLRCLLPLQRSNLVKRKKTASSCFTVPVSSAKSATDTFQALLVALFVTRLGCRALRFVNTSHLIQWLPTAPLLATEPGLE